MTVHREKTCACGHSAFFHTAGGKRGRCLYGHDRSRFGTTVVPCTCAKFHRRASPAAKYDAEPSSPAAVPALLAQQPEVLAAIDDIIRGFTRLRRALPLAPTAGPPPAATTVVHRDVKPENVTKPKRTRAAPRTDDGEPLTKAERQVLTALAQNLDGLTKKQLAIVSGYSGKSGGFRNTLSSLRSAHRIDGGRDTPFVITGKGVTDLGDFTPLPRGRELLEHWKRLAGDACARRLLDDLAAAYPEKLTKEELGERAGYQPTSGGFRNALSRLRTLELMDGRRGESLSLSPSLASAIGLTS